MNTDQSRGPKIPEVVERELAELDRLAAAGIALVPPLKAVAEFVRLQRAMLSWKQEALASFAQVSLSTIQRVERAETVSADSLDKIALALHQPPGTFTTPRVPLGATEVQKQMKEEVVRIFTDRTLVDVRPLRSQTQISALARTHINIFDTRGIAEDCEAEIENIRESLSFLSFVIAQEDKGQKIDNAPLKRRTWYARVLRQAKAVERKTNSVALVGTYTATANLKELPIVEVGVIAFFCRQTDPGAVKRQVLLAPKAVDIVAGWKRFVEAAD